MTEQVQDPAPGPEASPKAHAGFEIGTQIKLSWAKAIEISFNSVKIRFWRSMITAGGVVLAITFLMATLTNSTVSEAVKTGLPGQMKAARGEISKYRAVWFAKVEAAAAHAEPLAKVKKAVATSDYDRAQQFFTSAIDNGKIPRDDPAVEELQLALTDLAVAASRYTGLERLRIEFIKRGENIPIAEGGRRKQTTLAPIDLNKERVEAKARDRWLIFLALLVALVGITNAMLMSVTERFREIGTMKCLGALDSFIVKLFLIESSMQGFLGTFCGVILGLALSFAKLFWDFDGLGEFLPWAALAYWVMVSLACGTFIAVAGALYPSYVAAKMEPVVAMRVDQ